MKLCIHTICMKNSKVYLKCCKSITGVVWYIEYKKSNRVYNLFAVR